MLTNNIDTQKLIIAWLGEKFASHVDWSYARYLHGNQENGEIQGWPGRTYREYQLNCRNRCTCLIDSITDSYPSNLKYDI